MALNSNGELPREIRSNLTDDQQTAFREVYNLFLDHDGEEFATRVALTWAMREPKETPKTHQPEGVKTDD